MMSIVAILKYLTRNLTILLFDQSSTNCSFSSSSSDFSDTLQESESSDNDQRSAKKLEHC